MKKYLSLALLLSLALPSMAWAEGSKTASNPRPDNSAINARDTQGGPLTPENQSSKPEDVELTRQIRQALVSDDGLSILAKNIKIISVGGMVTLRGPVRSAGERDQIFAKAAGIAGDVNVNNLLEVASSN